MTYSVAVKRARNPEDLISKGWVRTPWQPELCWADVDHLPCPARVLARRILDAADAEEVHVYLVRRDGCGPLVAIAKREG